MQEMTNIAAESGNDTGQEKPLTDPQEDGRNKEWQDRARVNLEQVPKGTHTNIERDFEVETPEEPKKKNGEKDGSAY
ncbi:MAG: hypothetical protein ABIN89_12080 [Chitinophagaceae bacterium]